VEDDEFDDGFNNNAVQQQTKAKVEDSKEAKDNQYSVTGVSWNCNGSSLAVAYGKTNHVSWCEH
jgi:WD40 repeat protein